MSLVQWCVGRKLVKGCVSLSVVSRLSFVFHSSKSPIYLPTCVIGSSGHSDGMEEPGRRQRAVVEPLITSETGWAAAWQRMPVGVFLAGYHGTSEGGGIAGGGDYPADEVVPRVGHHKHVPAVAGQKGDACVDIQGGRVGG